MIFSAQKHRAASSTAKAYADLKKPALLSLYKAPFELFAWLGPNAPVAPEGPIGPISDSLAYTTFLPPAPSVAGSGTACMDWSCAGPLPFVWCPLCCVKAPYGLGAAVCAGVRVADSRGPTGDGVLTGADLVLSLVAVLVAAAVAAPVVRGPAAVAGLRANQLRGAVPLAALGLFTNAGDV